MQRIHPLSLDSKIASCQPCKSAKAVQQKKPLLVHPVPELLISAGMFDWQSTQYLILVDSYSGRFEMNSLSDLSAKNGYSEDEAPFLCAWNSMQIADRQWLTNFQ